MPSGYLFNSESVSTVKDEQSTHTIAKQHPSGCDGQQLCQCSWRRQKGEICQVVTIFISGHKIGQAQEKLFTTQGETEKEHNKTMDGICFHLHVTDGRTKSNRKTPLVQLVFIIVIKATEIWQCSNPLETLQNKDTTILSSPPPSPSLPSLNWKWRRFKLCIRHFFASVISQANATKTRLVSRKHLMGCFYLSFLQRKNLTTFLFVSLPDKTHPNIFKG